MFDLESYAISNNVTFRLEVGDVTDLEYCNLIIGSPPTKCCGDGGSSKCGLSIFHLGAVMSGAPPDLAMSVNLRGTMNMLDATRPWQEASLLSSRSNWPRVGGVEWMVEATTATECC